MGSLSSQLLRHEQRWLRDSTPSADAGATLLECFARRWDYATELRSQGYDERRLAKIQADRETLYPHFSPEQVRIALALDSVREGVGLSVGVARRILRDDPAELGLGLALDTRLVWFWFRLAEQAGGGTDGDDAGFLPSALAVRDGAMAERLLETPPPAGVERDPANDLFLQGWLTIYRRDLKALRAIAEKLGKRKVDRTWKWLVQGFAAIAEQDAAKVLAALGASLAEAQRQRMQDESQFPMSIETHQYYRGAEWVSPELVAGFDVTLGLPWDAGFHAWTEEHPEPVAGLDLNAISPLLHQAVIELKVPDWFRTLDGPESPRDTCLPPGPL